MLQKILIGIAFVLFSSFAKGDVKFTIAAKTGPVEFDVLGEGPAVEKDIQIVGETVSGIFRAKLADFKTGMGARDEHLKLTLETEKFPLATLKVENLPFKQGDFPFSGLLELHGVAKMVEGTATMKDKNVKAEFKINKKDFKIDIPDGIMKRLGANVKDDIKIIVEFDY
jgi:hypothetical protein